jgi:16S rRNA (uracil1498-N3)-methyltransferase
MQCFYAATIKNGEFVLDDRDSRHLSRVLRKKVGDKVLVTSGEGVIFTATVVDLSNDRATLKVLDPFIADDPSRPRLFLGLAPPKKTQRLEWLVEKAVEIGVDKIILLRTDRTEKTHWRMERLVKTAISALKQSLNPVLPHITEMVALNDLIQSPEIGSYQKFIAKFHRDHRCLKDLVKQGRNACVLIGPEGDFSPDEYRAALEADFQPVNLSGNRLRTETAALVALTTIKNAL